MVEMGLLDTLTSPYGLFILCVGCVLLALRMKFRVRNNSPPTIPGHWFFKNQKLLQTSWRAMLMANKFKPLYGDIIQLSTPFGKRIVLNSSEAVSEVLEKHSASTSNRPRNVMLFELTGAGDTVVFRQHDERHRKLRRIIASALHPAAARSYAELHTTSASYFLRAISARIKSGATPGGSTTEGSSYIDTKPMGNNSETVLESVRDTIGRFIIRMTYGHVVVEDDPILAIANRMVEFVTTGFSKHYWVNDFPILRHIPHWFPGAAFKRQGLYAFEQRQIAANEPFGPVLSGVNQGMIERPSYSSKLLELKGGINATEEDIDLIKWSAATMFTAGSTTTTALVYSFIFTMSIRPDVAARIQAEIDAQVGRDRIPTLHDRETLPYMEAVLQEVIRFYPVFPFGLEHCVSEDFEIRGYTIQKGTTVEANIWALMHESKTYPNPHVFDPERFLKPIPDPDPRRFLFGFGRRVCPGQHVANNGAFTMCAAFMSVFNIVAGEKTLKQAEHCGRDIWRMFRPFGTLEPMPFECTITPRDDAAVAVLEACKDTIRVT
ncbi:cytochrome P450 [Ceratobasidium sp. AG-I]|nr:cytochrome P450 [Ceratobasidium sp. AG-I]